MRLEDGDTREHASALKSRSFTSPLCQIGLEGSQGNDDRGEIGAFVHGHGWVTTSDLALSLRSKLGPWNGMGPS
jgi:hypothetical protein